MLEYQTMVNGRYVNAHGGDGFVAATPTGSTAYALSVGGPILGPDMDAIVLAVGHREFVELQQADLEKIYKDAPNKNKVLIDIKGILNRNECETAGYQYWRL